MIGTNSVRGMNAITAWRGRPLAAAALIALVAVRVIDPAPLVDFRLRLFDAFQQLVPRQSEAAPVVIVDIDEASLSKYGQWPWPRTLIAELIDTIAAGNPFVIGFDILFPEPDRMSPQQIAAVVPDMPEDIMARLAALPSNDQRLAESFAQIPVVLGVGALNIAAVSAESAPQPRTPVMTQGADPKPFLWTYPSLLRSVEPLRAGSAGEGALSSPPERDGVVRRAPLILSVGAHVFPSIGLEMLRVATGANWFTVLADDRGVTGVNVANVLVPSNDDGRVWLHFTQHKPSRFVSAAALLDGTVAPEALADRLVLIGTTGLGLTDFVTTPVAARMPGIEVHAQLIEAMIEGELLSRPRELNWIEPVSVVVAGLALLLLVPIIRPAWTIAPATASVLIWIAGSWIAYREFNLLVDPGYPVVGTIIIYGILLGSSLIAADQARKQLQADLAQQRLAAQRLEGELMAARDIQMGILPRTFPAFPERTEFDLHAVIEPARAVGGDLYDFAMIDDDHLFFMVGDVSGKGVPASLFMAITKALYKSSALRRKVAIDQIMTEANAEVSRENPAMLFVTVLAGLLNVKTGEVQLCNAGHDPPFLLSPGKMPRPINNVGGPPLCALEDFEYPSETVTLNAGDALVVYTDGVAEAVNPAGEFYSLARLALHLTGVTVDHTPEQIVSSITDDVADFADGAEAADDLTILAVQFRGATAPT